jgi:hypothetical protein
MKFEYWGMTIRNQNCFHERIKNRLNSGNSCYHADQNCLSFCLLSRNIKVKIYKAVILCIFCMGVKPGLSHQGKNTD